MLPKYLYDPRCEELAKYFLADPERIAREGDIQELAQTIQFAIEDWLQHESMKLRDLGIES